MAFSNDVDWDFLDRVIALADDIGNKANAVKDISDDPDVLLEALKMESAALVIKKSARDYRERLRRLKKIEEIIRDKIKTARLVERAIGEKVAGPLGATGLQRRTRAR